MHRSILETTPRFGVCWHPLPGAAGREALPAPAAGPGGREAAAPRGAAAFCRRTAALCPAAVSGETHCSLLPPNRPFLQPPPALPSHKRIPVIPLEGQSLIIPPSLSDETRKLAPYRKGLPGAQRGSQLGEAGGGKPGRAARARASPRPPQPARAARGSPRAAGGSAASPGAAPPGRRQPRSTWSFA